MKIFMFGVGCVGKSTIGMQLAKETGYKFIDFDKEIEHYYNLPLSRIKNCYLNSKLYRYDMSFVLLHVINKADDNFIIAMPPDGLCDYYWKNIKKIDGVKIVLKDKPENILKRIVFFDVNSRPIGKELTGKQKEYYLAEIREDIRYFSKFYKRADYEVDITGLDVDMSVIKIKELVKALEG